MLTMQTSKSSLGHTYQTAVKLESGPILLINTDWDDVRGRGWLFGISVNVEGRANWDVKIPTHSVYCGLFDAVKSLGVDATPSEVYAITNFITQHKSDTHPNIEPVRSVTGPAPIPSVSCNIGSQSLSPSSVKNFGF